MWVGMLKSKVIKVILLDETLRKISILNWDLCIIEFVWEYASLRYGAKIWHGGRTQGLTAYFQSNSIKGQRSSRGQVAVEMAYGYQIW